MNFLVARFHHRMSCLHSGSLTARSSSSMDMVRAASRKETSSLATSSGKSSSISARISCESLTASFSVVIRTSAPTARSRAFNSRTAFATADLNYQTAMNAANPTDMTAAGQTLDTATLKAKSTYDTTVIAANSQEWQAFNSAQQSLTTSGLDANTTR